MKLGEGGRVRSWEYEGEEKKVGRGEKKVARGAGIATSTSALPSAVPRWSVGMISNAQGSFKDGLGPGNTRRGAEGGR